MSEKTTSITEAIQSGDNIPPAVYQMWIEDLMREREVMVEALKNIYYDISSSWVVITAISENALDKAGELQ
jgi:hypothetical protein